MSGHPLGRDAMLMLLHIKLEQWIRDAQESIEEARSKRARHDLFTATQRFATTLIKSQKKLFRYDLVWIKNVGTGFVNANCRPISSHENILIFSRATCNSMSKHRMIYNAQKTHGKPYVRRTGTSSKCYESTVLLSRSRTHYGPSRHPVSVLFFDVERGLHPTQKPVAMLEWLIKTYTHAGDTVLDPTAGSGTTLIAAANTGRRAICIERDATYCQTIMKRYRDRPPTQGRLAISA